MSASVLGAFASRSSVDRWVLWLANVGLVGDGIAALCHRIATVVCKSRGSRRGRLRETGLSELSTDRFGEWQVPGRLTRRLTGLVTAMFTNRRRS